MLPKKLRLELFDRLSTQTMRYVKSVPCKEATGLVKQVYEMISDDFFINGSLTSHSKVPPLLAGIWTGGRESILVDDQMDRLSKEAITAVVSQINDCTYCEDMLISLVHASHEHDAAKQLFAQNEDNIEDDSMRAKLIWTKEILTSESGADLPLPFTPEALPEVIASILAISHINRFSHVVMDGSPVNPILGSRNIKGIGLRMFGNELKSSKTRPLVPDRTASLLPGAPLPEDMVWAEDNERIAQAVARWTGVVERESAKIASWEIRDFVGENLGQWDGFPMPLSRSWVEEETTGFSGGDRDLARFALIVAKSSTQMDENLVKRVFQTEEQFIRTLAWASFSGARRVAALVAQKTNGLVTA